MKKYQLPDQSQVRRLFTFGCSFTDYNFDTWANILGDYYSKSEFYNYGAAGAGNVAIASKITQANILHQFNKDDLIIVCWTSSLRESRILSNQGEWSNTGSVLTSPSLSLYDNKFVKRYVNETHYVLESLTQMHLINSLLRSSGSRFYYLFMMHPLIHEPTQVAEPIKTLTMHPNIMQTYSKDIEKYSEIHSYQTLLKSLDTYEHLLLPHDPTHLTSRGHGVYLENVFDIDLSSVDFDAKIAKSAYIQQNWAKVTSATHYYTFRKSDPLHPAIFY